MRNFSEKIDGAAPLPSGILGAEEDNVRFNELKTAVSTTGIALDSPDGPDSRTDMLAEAACRSASGGVFYRDVGLVNAYVLEGIGDFVVPHGYFQGMCVKFRPGLTNTGPATVNVNALGIKKVFTAGGAPLAGGELAAESFVELLYDPALDSGVGGFALTLWSDKIGSTPGGVPIYQGKVGGRHMVRSLQAGTNVTIDTVETAEGSGLYRVRISAAASGGGGGGGNPLANIGGGAEIYKGFNDPNDELRSLVGANGIICDQGADEIQIGLDDISAWTVLLRNAGSAGTPAATTLIALTDEATPALNDVLLLGKAADGALRKVSILNLLKLAVTSEGSGPYSRPLLETKNSQTIISASTSYGASATIATIDLGVSYLKNFAVHGVMTNGGYLVEISYDAGATWSQVAAVGGNGSSGDYAAYASIRLAANLAFIRQAVSTVLRKDIGSVVMLPKTLGVMAVAQLSGNPDPITVSGEVGSGANVALIDGYMTKIRIRSIATSPNVFTNLTVYWD